MYFCFLLIAFRANEFLRIHICILMDKNDHNAITTYSNKLLNNSKIKCLIYINKIMSSYLLHMDLLWINHIESESISKMYCTINNAFNLWTKPMQNMCMHVIFLIRVRCIITGDFSTKIIFKMSNRNIFSVESMRFGVMKQTNNMKHCICNGSSSTFKIWIIFFGILLFQSSINDC